MDKLEFEYVGSVRQRQRQLYAWIAGELTIARSLSGADTVPSQLPSQNLATIRSYISQLQAHYRECSEECDADRLIAAMCDDFADCIRWWEEPWKMEVEWVVFRRIVTEYLTEEDATHLGARDKKIEGK